MTTEHRGPGRPPTIARPARLNASVELTTREEVLDAARYFEVTESAFVRSLIGWGAQGFDPNIPGCISCETSVSFPGMYHRHIIELARQRRSNRNEMILRPDLLIAEALPPVPNPDDYPVRPRRPVAVPPPTHTGRPGRPSSLVRPITCTYIVHGDDLDDLRDRADSHGLSAAAFCRYLFAWGAHHFDATPGAENCSRCKHSVRLPPPLHAHLTQMAQSRRPPLTPYQLVRQSLPPCPELDAAEARRAPRKD